MEKIIRNYQLFKIDKEEFQSIISYSDLGSDKAETSTVPPVDDAPTGSELSVNCSPTDSELPTNSETRAKSRVKEKQCNKLADRKMRVKLNLLYIREEKTKRRGEKEERKNDDDDRLQKPSSQTLPIRSWQKLVDELPTGDSLWLDVACMKSGYGALLKRHIKAATKIFKEHIVAYDKGGNLLSMSEVHSYFVNFSRAGTRTSAMLRDRLLSLDARETATSNLPPNPYRHELRIDGRRTYQGCTIPDDAPPRPDAKAVWNETTQQWMTTHKSKHPGSPEPAG